ncbi:Septin-domain-containing protein [Ramicandelaber brevisporus]|nr:Septin-domain-containing protein [Ramicandelaber brevisporus]
MTAAHSIKSSTSSYARPSSHRTKTAKKGIPLTIMFVGMSGLGRSTFINTLCERMVVQKPPLESPESAHIAEPMQFKTYPIELEEDQQRISLTIVDTPGFGDSLDNEECFQKILAYIEDQHDEALAEESRIRRNTKFKDGRVHALLYFITPTGHSLREVDIELMRRVGHRVNVIPVIGRADSLTSEELAEFKQRIMKDISYYKIPTYDFPTADEEDEDTAEENAALRRLLPFAVVGCDDVIDEDGRSIRVRDYPWGRVEVDNIHHNDFDRLRYVLLNSHLHELRAETLEVHYENYRSEKLSDDVNDADDAEEDDDNVPVGATAAAVAAAAAAASSSATAAALGTNGHSLGSLAPAVAVGAH